MKKKYYVFIAVATLLVVAWVWLLSEKTTPPKTAIQQEDRIVESKPEPFPSVVEKHPETTDLSGDNYSYDKVILVSASGAEGKQKAWEAAWNAPIDFWGKVVDEKDQPIGEANIKYSINNDPNPNAKLTDETMLTDAKGEFSVRDRKGASIYVSVSKDGYYSITSDTGNNARSSGTFSFWERGNSNVLHPQKLPTSRSPIIFVLKKKGEPAALIKKSMSSKMLKDGTPAEFNLETGKKVATGGDIRVEFWTGNQEAQKKFDWKCRISIPDGGLIERTDVLDFQAPEDGYQASEEVSVSQNDERWTDSAKRKYFVKLSGNRYARLTINVVAHGDCFFDVQSYLNPEQGNRNLEYDKPQEIK